MNTKRLLCAVLAAAFAVALSAQATRSDLERVSLDFAERLISDGGSEKKISELSQYLSDADKAHLAEYRELDGLMRRASKIKKNRAAIADKAVQFTPDEREDLYFAHRVKNRYFWNYLPVPCLGIGSFVQGDVSGGLLQLAGLGLSGICLFTGFGGGGGRQMVDTGIAIAFATPIAGMVCPIIFKSSRNAMLRSSLNLNDYGTAVAQAADVRDVQLSFAPIANPVTNQYGAVALIRF